jgi:salicylaldehyde dehydrogenase
MQSQLIIDNQTVAAQSGATFTRNHPNSGEVITNAAAGGVEDALAAVNSAQTAFLSWRNSAPSERRRLLLKAADVLESKTPQFIEVMAAEAPGG